MGDVINWVSTVKKLTKNCKLLPWLLSCNKKPVNGMHGPQPEDNVIIVCGVYAKDFFALSFRLQGVLP